MTDTAFREDLRAYSAEPTDVLAHRISQTVLRQEPMSKYEGMTGEYIKIRYDAGETGWAVDLGDNIARIANNPLCGDIRNGDIVSLKRGVDGWVTWDEVLERKFAHSAVLYYKDSKFFYVLSGACRIKGWPLEGGIAPRDEHEGLCSINYTEKDGLRPFLEQLGLSEHVRIAGEGDADGADE